MIEHRTARESSGSATFMDYLLSTACDVPRVEIERIGAEGHS
jgi:hypothetical protein